MSTVPAESPLAVLWAGSDPDWTEWKGPLRSALCGLARVVRDAPDPAAVDAILYAPDGALRDFAPFVNARLVQSLWAGVERIAGNPTLTQPLARMVDPGLRRGMVEWCLGWAMRMHLGMDRYAQDGVWRNHVMPPLAPERRITVLGAGELGGAVARALVLVGFKVTVWSASGREVEDARSLAGPDTLVEALRGAEILIGLLPDTAATRGLLDARHIALLPDGAHVLNPGRGTLIDDRALLAALDRGRLGHAVLDVFETEPLPATHPFWRHPRVTVTPHIAASTRAATAVATVAENLKRLREGQPLLYLVDRDRGY